MSYKAFWLFLVQSQIEDSLGTGPFYMIKTTTKIIQINSFNDKVKYNERKKNILLPIEIWAFESNDLTPHFNSLKR